jgi:hypothetical protein
MTPLELSPSPPAASTPRLREPASDAARPLPPVRELSRLIADIRKARQFLEAVGETSEAVSLEHVVGADPRD